MKNNVSFTNIVIGFTIFSAVIVALLFVAEGSPLAAIVLAFMAGVGCKMFISN